MTEITQQPATEEVRRAEVEDALSVVSTLSVMQRRFLIEYLSAEKPNATSAAEKAGYSTPNKSGPRLLKNPKVREAIDEFFHGQEMSAREVIARLSNQARGSLGDFLDIEDGHEPTLNLAKARRAGKLHLLKKFKQKRVTFVGKEDNETVTEWIDIELHDPQSALVHVGRYHGLFGPKGTEDDPVHSVGMTLDEWRAESQKRRQQAAETAALFEDDDDDVATED